MDIVVPRLRFFSWAPPCKSVAHIARIPSAWPKWPSLKEVVYRSHPFRFPVAPRFARFRPANPNSAAMISHIGQRYSENPLDKRATRLHLGHCPLRSFRSFRVSDTLLSPD